MAKYKVAVLGGGAIFSRHLAALQAYPEDYQFIGLFDPKASVVDKWRSQFPELKYYSCEEEVYQDSEVNCIVILTPSNLHYVQAKKALESSKSIIVEKPVSFDANQVLELESLAVRHNVEAFCVLQVRINPSIAIAKQIMTEGLLGDIRGAGLIQRWQRPLDYFSGWRGKYSSCGGVLFEFGIHYLDIMQQLLGTPKVVAANSFYTKFQGTDVSDTTYALFDFGSFGGTMEVSLAAEPRNIELSLTIMGSKGYLKLGGRSLDQILGCEFLDPERLVRYKQICSEILGVTIDNQVTIGACPHHPELYKQIIHNPYLFAIKNTHDVIQLVSEINALDKRSS